MVVGVTHVLIWTGLWLHHERTADNVPIFVRDEVAKAQFRDAESSSYVASSNCIMRLQITLGFNLHRTATNIRSMTGTNAQANLYG